MTNVMRGRGWTGLGLALCAFCAAAHDADVVYVSAQDGAQPGTVAEVVTLTAATLGQLAPVDDDGDGMLSQADLDARADALAAGVWAEMPLEADRLPCRRSATRAVLREGFVELEASFVCGPGELRQDFRFLRVLSSNYRVVLGSQLEGEGGKAFAHGAQTALTIPRPGGRWRPSVEGGFGLPVWVLALAGVGVLLLLAGAVRVLRRRG